MVSFDLKREVFASMELPVVYHDFRDHALTMVYDDGGCGCSLGVVNFSGAEGSVWILQRFGDDSKSWSWVRCYTFVIITPQLGSPFELLHFLCMTKNREMLLTWAPLCSRNSVICYDLETQQERRLLEKNRKPLCGANAFPYVESLILLHH